MPKAPSNTIIKTDANGAPQAATAADITGQLLTGFISGEGTVAATDTILQGINKLAGNLGTKVTNPMTAAGDLIIGGTSGAPARLGKGQDGQVLTLVSGVPVWATAPYVNHIGVPGAAGFGVGICPNLPAGFTPLSGYTDPASDNYGNYTYSDGSVMVWVPAFYYKYGTGSNGLAVNAVSIKAYSAYPSVAEANADGFALHRAFYDGGTEQKGVFVDKYLCSNNNGTASSIKNAAVITSAVRGSLSTATFASLTGAPANAYYGAIAAARTRGANFFCSSRFIFSALALLSYAHARASTATTWCAWYDATNNFPKGCNNNALRDTNDSSVLYTTDNNGTYNCGLTGSGTLFAKTTHNGQNCGVADLNGLAWEINPGLTSDGTNLYVLKTSASMKAVTAGTTLATDLWGATGIAALYTDLGTRYEAWTGANNVLYFGSASQVFAEAVSGTAWNVAGAGIPLTAGTGGTNLFGQDGFWNHKPNTVCPISGGNGAIGSFTGVWTIYLSHSRANSGNDVGFRAALYL